MTWLGELRERNVLEVARALDLAVYDGGRHLGPCPECRETTRSRRDTRPGPLFVVKGGRGWCCGRCGSKGSVVDLLALSLFGERLPQRDPRWAELRQRAAALGIGGPVEEDTPRWEPPPRQRVLRSELEALWAAAAPADEDPAVSAWLVRRGIDPDLAGERDLCRALPEGELPRWAHFRGAPWSIGWRCLFRVFDAEGRLASLRARWVAEDPPPDGGEKCGAAAGGPGSAGGAVLACGVGQQVLEHGVAPGWWDTSVPFEVVICEGEPDWLTWAARIDALPTIGLFSGAWDATIAARIPDGSRIAMRAHLDEAGMRYAQKVVESLWSRCLVFGPAALRGPR